MFRACDYHECNIEQGGLIVIFISYFATMKTSLNMTMRGQEKQFDRRLLFIVAFSLIYTEMNNNSLDAT